MTLNDRKLQMKLCSNMNTRYNKVKYRRDPKHCQEQLKK